MAVSLRRQLHFMVADALHYSGALALWRFVRRAVLRKQETCVLGLHRVLTKAEQSRTNSLDGMVISDATFVKMLEYLHQKFDVVSLEDFLAQYEANPPRPRCLVTFDDGWSDTYSHAYAWLKKFEVPAVLFLATGSMEAKSGFWVEQVCGAFKTPAARARMDSYLNHAMPKNGAGHDAESVVEWLKHMPAQKRDVTLYELLPPNANTSQAAETEATDSMMTWPEAAEMSRDGIEMGAHTVTHPLLTYEDDDAAQRELRESKKTIEEHLSRPVRAFAYPNGDFDERIRNWTEQTGYACAFTTQPGWYSRGEDRYTIPRILLHEGNITGRDGQFSPAMFSLTLAGRA